MGGDEQPHGSAAAPAVAAHLDLLACQPATGLVVGGGEADRACAAHPPRRHRRARAAPAGYRVTAYGHRVMTAALAINDRQFADYYNAA